MESERRIISKSSYHLDMHTENVYLCLPNKDENRASTASTSYILQFISIWFSVTLGLFFKAADSFAHPIRDQLSFIFRKVWKILWGNPIGLEVKWRRRRGGKGSVVANRGKRGNCRTLAANEVGEGRGGNGNITKSYVGIKSSNFKTKLNSPFFLPTLSAWWCITIVGRNYVLITGPGDWKK